MRDLGKASGINFKYWAIQAPPVVGTGKNPSPNDALMVSSFLRGVLLIRQKYPQTACSRLPPLVIARHRSLDLLAFGQQILNPTVIPPGKLEWGNSLGLRDKSIRLSHNVAKLV